MKVLKLEAPGPDPVTVVLECDGVEQRQVVDPGARTMVTVSFQVSLTKGVPARRRLSPGRRLRATPSIADLRWLAATRWPAREASGLVIDGRGLSLAGMGGEARTISGRATLIRRSFLHLTVTVEDDRVVRNRQIPSAFDSGASNSFSRLPAGRLQAAPLLGAGSLSGCSFNRDVSCRKKEAS